MKLKRLFSGLLAIGSLILLAACDKMEVMNPQGPIAAAEKHLLIDAVLLMLIVVIPVIILTIIISYKYRASNTRAKYSPNWAHATLLEAGWWIIPIVIIAVLATMTWRTTHALDPYKPLASKVEPITIQVVSLEWRWLFIYPEQNIATINFVEFPVDTPINFLITSDAPMNSFQIQRLAGQIYAMAGMQTKLHLLANTTGDYDGRSVSFSGDGFTNMTFTARVTSREDFDAWVNSVKHEPNALTMDAYNQLIAPSKDTSVHYYSSVSDNLFNNIIMKFMGPDMGQMQNMQMKATPPNKVENMTKSQQTKYKSHRQPQKSQQK
jgi:cytochrome o ubiquinol oxidase subunit 2